MDVTKASGEVLSKMNLKDIPLKMLAKLKPSESRDNSKFKHISERVTEQDFEPK